MAESVAEVDAEQPASQAGPSNGRARETDRAHRLDLTPTGSDAEVGPREHQAMAMVPADALGHGPVECRRPRPRKGTISRSSGRAADQHQRRDPVGGHVRTFDGETECHCATHRVAHHDGAAEIEHVEHRGEIVHEACRSRTLPAQPTSGRILADRRQPRGGHPPPTAKPAERRSRGWLRDRAAGPLASRNRTPRRAACRRREWRWHGSARPERRNRHPRRDPAWHRAVRGRDARRSRRRRRAQRSAQRAPDVASHARGDGPLVDDARRRSADTRTDPPPCSTRVGVAAESDGAVRLSALRLAR